MMSFPNIHFKLACGLAALLGMAAPVAAQEAPWWNKEWTQRKQIVLDTSAAGVPISGPIGTTPLLVRLHDGNFQLHLAKEDGSDLRFVAADGQTVLPHHFEKIDTLLNEVLVWVRAPEVKPSEQNTLWLYFGNANATPVADSAGTYDADTTLVYHFAESGSPPADASGNGHGAAAAAPTAEGTLIGAGLRLDGRTAVTIPAAPGLAWTAGDEATISLWIKPAQFQQKEAVFSRRANGVSFVLGLDQGVPYVEITGAAGVLRTPASTALTLQHWHHLAVTATGGQITLYANGESYATLAAALPAFDTPLVIGADSTADPVTGGVSFTGELDEFVLSKVARPAGAVAFAAFSQSGDKGPQLVAVGADEAGGAGSSAGGGGHSGYMAVIIKSLTFDGWVVIVILAFMMLGSWWVMANKVSYLNAVSKGNEAFMKEWRHLSSDLTALDDGDVEHAKALGGRVDKSALRKLRGSSVYRIYHIGVEEIRHRLVEDKKAGKRGGLTGRSIQAIRASLDGGLVRETQKINSLIVLLTICISGGPFLGLLGTVVGVMITFAAVAAAGDVNVNAIAPGIAAALLATVAGLAVAIPALFGYNYILSRVKDAKDDMHVFIDEFVTKMAEFYREPAE